MRSILESLAPSRYQFTETTLDFSADLSESMDAGLTAGIGFGAAAIVVNASLTIGYGYDYRAASRITTVLHAIPANPEMAKTLLERATEIRKDKLTLPDKNEVDKEIFKAAKEIYDALTETQAGDADGNPAGGGTT
jgi:hypothetical protein